MLRVRAPWIFVDVLEGAGVKNVVPMNNATAIAAFSSLAYETRLAVVQLLANVGAEGLPAGDIARRLGVQKNTLSDHLRALKTAGVLNSERMGRMIVYRTNADVMTNLVKFMGETCVSPDRPM